MRVTWCVGGEGVKGGTDFVDPKRLEDRLGVFVEEPREEAAALFLDPETRQAC